MPPDLLRWAAQTAIAAVPYTTISSYSLFKFSGSVPVLVCTTTVFMTISWKVALKWHEQCTPCGVALTYKTS